ncbi:MAG: hypothetical protein ACLU38_03905 [Dysosmobacter sp.]
MRCSDNQLIALGGRWRSLCGAGGQLSDDTASSRRFAYKVGAIDVPKDEPPDAQQAHPRLGGLAIFLGFMVSILLFVDIDAPRCRASCWARSSSWCWAWWTTSWPLPAKLKFRDPDLRRP